MNLENTNSINLTSDTLRGVLSNSFDEFTLSENGRFLNGISVQPNALKTVDSETKTKLYVENGKLRLTKYKDGEESGDHYVMPAISDFNVINGKKIITTFSDGTIEKVVLDKQDEFSLEQGIAICVMKKVLSTHLGNGSSVYNKIVEYGLKTYNKITSEKSKKQREEERMAIQKKNKAEKAKKRREKEIARKREEIIEIQKEAYIRAMRELNS